MASGRGRMKGKRVSRRDAMRLIGVTTGAVAAAPAVFAQGIQTPSTVTNPPRDFRPGAPPTLYFNDPDVLTIDPAFDRLVQPNAPIQRLWTGGLWLEGPAWNSVGRFLVFSDIPNNRQWRWIEDDERVSLYR